MRALSEAELFDVNAGFNAAECGQLMIEGGAFFGTFGALAGGLLGSVVPGAGTAAGAYLGGALGTLAGGAIAAEEGAVCS